MPNLSKRPSGSRLAPATAAATASSGLSRHQRGLSQQPPTSRRPSATAAGAAAGSSRGGSNYYGLSRQHASDPKLPRMQYQQQQQQASRGRTAMPAPASFERRTEVRKKKF